MAENKTVNPKFYSRYSFSSVAISSRNVKLRKRLDLAKMFPAGMGAIYSFEFSVGPSDNDNDQARLHYIGLSFSNPTLERVEGHREDAKSASKKTLDYLGYAAAVYNERPGARNVSRFQDLVEVMNIVSIFDLALMERYYIQTEKTMGSGFNSYQREIRLNKVREAYGKKRDKKASIKLARAMFDKGEISSEDFNELALEGVLGADLFNQVKTIREQHICKAQQMLRDAGMIK